MNAINVMFYSGLTPLPPALRFFSKTAKLPVFAGIRRRNHVESMRLEKQTCKHGYDDLWGSFGRRVLPDLLQKKIVTFFHTKKSGKIENLKFSFLKLTFRRKKNRKQKCRNNIFRDHFFGKHFLRKVNLKNEKFKFPENFRENFRNFVNFFFSINFFFR